MLPSFDSIRINTYPYSRTNSMNQKGIAGPVNHPERIIEELVLLSVFCFVNRTICYHVTVDIGNSSGEVTIHLLSTHLGCSELH